MKVDTASIIVVAKNQLASSVGDETVILGLTEGRYYGVNNVGARVWQLIQTPTSIAAIRDTLVSEYEVDAERCEADLLQLVSQMADVQLIELHASADS